MRESFSEYKKTLEQNLINLSYLYSGDIIRSTDHIYSEIKNTPLTSPIFSIGSIVKIYEMSIQNLISNSKELVISEESLINSTLIQKLEEFGTNSQFIFCSQKSSKLFYGISMHHTSKPFPIYFYPKEKFTGINLSIYTSPIIDDDSDEMIFYTSDKPIQSLVYGLTNMDYTITPGDNADKEPHSMTWTHEMAFKFYECDFQSYKVVIRNLSKIRNQKLNTILNDN